ncbi:MAG: glycoside hydrolase family 97 N-terminal domain-containing protein [Marinilabiliales bacterium]|nr:glycoside hydrolase family 97 N-terminal domain-containing protein [Marinilabiliales bacterium]
MLEFRVYDDGVAYRFYTALKEQTTVIAEDFVIWFACRAQHHGILLKRGFMSHNEREIYLCRQWTRSTAAASCKPAGAVS